jgi:hypothetical protein
MGVKFRILLGCLASSFTSHSNWQTPRAHTQRAQRSREQTERR